MKKTYFIDRLLLKNLLKWNNLFLGKKSRHGCVNPHQMYVWDSLIGVANMPRTWNWLYQPYFSILLAFCGFIMISSINVHPYKEQAGAELCQAQESLGLLGLDQICAFFDWLTWFWFAKFSLYIWFFTVIMPLWSIWYG